MTPTTIDRRSRPGSGCCGTRCRARRVAGRPAGCCGRAGRLASTSAASNGYSRRRRPTPSGRPSRPWPVTSKIAARRWPTGGSLAIRSAGSGRNDHRDESPAGAGRDAALPPANGPPHPRRAVAQAGEVGRRASEPKGEGIGGACSPTRQQQGCFGRGRCGRLTFAPPAGGSSFPRGSWEDAPAACSLFFCAHGERGGAK